MIEKALKDAEQNLTPIALYGAGKYGRIALHNILREYPKVNVKCFIDDDLIRNDKAVDGIDIMSLKGVLEKYDEILIVISNYYVVESLKNLQRAAVDLSKVFFSNRMLIEFIEKEYIETKKNELSEVYNLLDDYESKAIYKAIIESRITYNIDILSRTCRGKQYFPADIFQIGKEEIFVDGGAFDGDTIDNFKQITGGCFKYIYAFEPDNYNYNKLAKKHQEENVKLFKVGLYKEDKITAFSSGKGGSSKITTNGDDTIKVCCLDNLEIPDRKVSFIKMDIEGSELDALKGMEKTICEHKPKLAICIYHKFEDLWEIPLYIKQLVPEYKIYIRNYTTYLDEIVLYATIETTL